MGQSQPSVGREGTNHARRSVSKKHMSTFSYVYVSHIPIPLGMLFHLLSGQSFTFVRTIVLIVCDIRHVYRPSTSRDINIAIGYVYLR